LCGGHHVVVWSLHLQLCLQVPVVDLNVTMKNYGDWPWEIPLTDLVKLFPPWELMLTLGNYFDLDWPWEIISALRYYVGLEKVFRSGHNFGTWHRTDIFCASSPALPALTLEIIPTLTHFLELIIHTLCANIFGIAQRRCIWSIHLQLSLQPTEFGERGIEDWPSCWPWPLPLEHFVDFFFCLFVSVNNRLLVIYSCVKWI
jgi:hypothetical protein